MTCSLCGGLKLTLFGPKITCFECDDRWTCIFVCVVVVEIGSVLDAGRKSLGSIEINLAFLWGVIIDLTSVWGGQTLLDFSLGIGIDLFCVLGRK